MEGKWWWWGGKPEVGVPAWIPCSERVLQHKGGGRPALSPSCPPSLGKRAPQTPSTDSLEPPTGGRKPRRTGISSGQPLRALSHSFCFSVPPCQQGAESDCATPPRKSFHPNSKRQGQSPPSSPPPSLQPTLSFSRRDLFPVNLVRPQGSWRVKKGPERT